MKTKRERTDNEYSDQEYRGSKSGKWNKPKRSNKKREQQDD